MPPGRCRCRCWTVWSALGERCRLVRGNADRELVAIRGGAWSEHPEIALGGRAARGPTSSELLAELPHPAVPGDRRVRSGGVLPRHAAGRRRGGAGRHPAGEVGGGVRRARSEPCGRWSAATPTCRSSGWSIAGWSSTRAASACRTADPAGPGPCCATGRSRCGTPPVDLDAAIAAVIAGSTYPRPGGLGRGVPAVGEQRRRRAPRLRSPRRTAPASMIKPRELRARVCWCFLPTPMSTVSSRGTPVAPPRRPRRARWSAPAPARSRSGLPALIFTEHLDLTGWMAAPEDFLEHQRHLIGTDGLMQPPPLDAEAYFASIERCRRALPRAAHPHRRRVRSTASGRRERCGRDRPVGGWTG